MSDTNFFNISPYISGVNHRDPTDDELHKIAHALRIEYRGTGVSVDWDNIHSRAQSYINQNKLCQFSIYTNISEKLVNTENDAYNKAPIRYFKTKDGKDVSPELTKYLTELLEQADWNSRLQACSRYTALEGTTLILPQIDPSTGQLMLIEESPSDGSLKVIPDASNPTRAYQISYKANFPCKQSIQLPDGSILTVSSITYVWDNISSEIIYNEGQPNEKVFIEPHGYKETPTATGGMPFAILRYKTDARRFWGPVDGSMFSICQLRSFLMADTIHRTQSNLFDLLIMIGFTPSEVASIMQTRTSGKVIPTQLDKDENGKPIPGSKDVKYVSPSGIEPEAVWSIWEKIFSQFLTMRGHSPNSFEAGSKNIQSYEGARLSNQYLYDLRDSKLNALVKFEKDLFKRVIWANNSVSGRLQIPEDTTIEIDWIPNSDEFLNAHDKVEYYTFALQKDIMTIPEIIQKEKGVSKETAKQMYEDNRATNNPIVQDTNNQPLVTQTINEVPNE
jgi:hypothetical protein